MSKQTKVLFCPIHYKGPINAAIGMAQVLRDSGHQIVFAIKCEFKGKLKIHGFDEEIMGPEVDTKNDHDGDDEFDVNLILGPESRLEKMLIFNNNFVEPTVKAIQKDDSFVEEIVKRVKPDVIIIDHMFWLPSLMDSGIPWVLVMSCNPLSYEMAFTDERLPPMCLGLPTNGDSKEWPKIRAKVDDSLSQSWKQFNDWVISKGSEPLPKNKMIRTSPYLNIYMYPKELDYTDIRQYPKNFLQFDCFKRTGVEEIFEIPEKLRNRSGKLIYLSMGSIGSANVPLMKKLVSFLSKSKHRFIVSKGISGDEYELPDNMWGQNFLPQIKILPIIDLIITHGGNNTLTETMYYGKPILVTPMFFDQFDNSQRLVEKGLSIELNPYTCTQTELLESIDKLLSDKILEQKLRAISKRIQTEENISKLPQIIENLVKEYN